MAEAVRQRALTISSASINSIQCGFFHAEFRNAKARIFSGKNTCP
jgi:hypothetical protein